MQIITDKVSIKLTVYVWGSLVDCSPWGRQELDTTERLHFHFSLSCIGEGNGNPLQCSCLGNPRDGGAWWAVIYGVAQSRTRLKRLSSSSSSQHLHQGKTFGKTVLKCRRRGGEDKFGEAMVSLCLEYLGLGANPPVPTLHSWSTVLFP